MRTQPPLDPRRGNIHIDANALDPENNDRTNVDRFLSLKEQGAISVVAPRGVRQEVLNPKTPAPVSQDVCSHIFTIQTADNSQEKARRKKIREILQGDAKLGKHDADADHVFEAQKYGGRYFITHDKRINKVKRDELEELLYPFSIVTLDEFLSVFDHYASAEQR